MLFGGQFLILYIDTHNCISYLVYQSLSLAGAIMSDLVFVLFLHFLVFHYYNFILILQY